MNDNELKGIIEGLLFVSGEDGLSIKQLAKITEISVSSMTHLLEELKESYDQTDRGLMIIKSHDIYSLTTKSSYSSYFKRLLETPRHTKLSQAALETLAIIALKQPITRIEIDDIRGVNSDRAIQTLVARSLVEEQGKESAGRPILYGTTKGFLTYFGLTSLDELPTYPHSAETDENVSEADLFFDRFNELETNYNNETY